MPHIDLKIINLNISHLEELLAISRSTYSHTFASSNTPEDMEDYLNKAFNTHQLTQELIEKEAVFYFAKWNEKTVGYLKFNFGKAQTEQLPGNGMELERIYVLHDFQGNRIGEQLLAFTLKTAQEYQLDYVWLGVWEKNLKAITFYQRNGFEIIGSHPFQMGDDMQTDYLMKREL